MAHITQLILQGLRIYTAWRQQMQHSEVHPQHGYRVVPHGNVARSKLELYILGNLLSGLPPSGEVLSGRKTRPCGIPNIYAARYPVRMDHIQI